MNYKKIFRFFWKNKLIILIILLLFFFYKSSFNVYFSQDDFFHLNFSKAKSIPDFINFFSFRNQFGYGFYRPLTTQVFLFIGQTVFGENYLCFKMVSFVIFCLNIILCYKIFKILFRNEERASLFACLIYSLSSFHLTTLSYLSAFEEIGVAFFFFLSFYTYLKDRKIAILFFTLALLSRETAVTLPLIILMYEIFIKKNKNIRALIKKVFPYFLILAIYILFRFYFKTFPDGKIYSFTFLPKKIINNYFWYSLWGLGAPESLVDFIGPGLKINTRFFLYFPPLGLFVLIFPILISIIILIRGINYFFKTKEKGNSYFLIAWFIVTLLPFVILLNHRFAYYLEIPFLGLSGLIATVFNKEKSLKILFILLFLLGSFLTVSFYNKTYWAINRSKISYKIINEIKNQFPKLPKGSVLYFLNDKNYISPSEQWGNTSTQARIALSECLGPQFVFNDPSLTCFFEDNSSPSASIQFYPLIVKLD